MFRPEVQGDRSKENRKAVLTSGIVAKAVIRRSSGVFEIIAVFQKSTRLEFYWVFQAKSARSARRSWKYVNHYPRDLNVSHPPYFNFNSLVAYHCVIQSADVVSQRMPHKRRLAALLVKTDNQSIYGNWTPQNPLRMTTDLCRRQAQHARDRRFAW